MSNQKQLYRTHNDLKLPESVTHQSHGNQIRYHTIESFPFMRWQNNKPCEAVNAYFIHLSNFTTGGTLNNYASKLAHLVRYCTNHNKSFIDLNDHDIWELSRRLQAERSLTYPEERIRNNNTVREILITSLNFLIWFQERFMVFFNSPLIGIKPQSPQIVVEIKQNSYYLSKARYPKIRDWNAENLLGWKKRANYLHHKALPTKVNVEPKRPIPTPVIEKIELTIENLALIENQNEASTRKYHGKSHIHLEQLEYIRARRRFMIWLMRRTGLRPSEMLEIDLQDNKNILETRAINIPTKKRRLKNLIIRRFPLRLKDTARFTRYISSRKKYISILINDDRSYTPPDSLFLSSNGSEIKKTSIEKDFARLVKLSGYKNTKVCFSMFRHRFITQEVIVHLKEFMLGSRKAPQLMTDQDYRSILKRVSEKTGHKSPESLWHYIDLAWKEMDVWSNIDNSLARLRATEDLFNELLNLRRELINASPTSSIQVVDYVRERLLDIITNSKTHDDNS